MDSKRNEHGNCRNGYRRRQMGGPTFSQQQPDARDDVCKAGGEIEPKDEGNDVAGSTSCLHAAKQGFPPTAMVTAPNAIATSARTTAKPGVRGAVAFMIRALAAARCRQTWQRPIQHHMANFTCIPLDINQARNWTFDTNLQCLCALRSQETIRAPTRLGYRPRPAAVLRHERNEFQQADNGCRSPQLSAAREINHRRQFARFPAYPDSGLSRDV